MVRSGSLVGIACGLLTYAVTGSREAEREAALGRDVGAARLQHLQHVERVARGGAVQTVDIDVDAVPVGERRDGHPRQALEPDPGDVAHGCERAEEHAEGMRAVELVVAVRDDHQGARAVAPSSEHA